MTKKDSLIAGLDIGSSHVRMAAGVLNTRAEKSAALPELQILGAAEVESRGVSKGVISNIEDAVSSVSACLERLERMVGVPVDRVWVGISGANILTQSNKGVVAVSKSDSEIALEDVNRALEAARAIATPLNYEILHVLPRKFSVDGQTVVKDPVGMTGIRLEVDTQIILGASAQIKNLTKAIYRVGLDIEDLVLTILSTAESAVTDRQKELGVAVLDLGATTTSVAVFEEGELIKVAVLPLGSDHITNDIAIGLRTSIEMAEAAKVEFGDCRSEMVSKRDEVSLSGSSGVSAELVKKRYLAEIIEARVEEIFTKVDEQFKTVKRSGLLPAGVILTGGGAKLPGMVDAAKKYLRLPAALGYPLGILGVTDKINDLSFAAAVGLVKWGAIMQGHDQGASPWGRSGAKMQALPGQFRKWLKALIP